VKVYAPAMLKATVKVAEPIPLTIFSMLNYPDEEIAELTAV
jgi:hypothetical protein